MTLQFSRARFNTGLVNANSMHHETMTLMAENRVPTGHIRLVWCGVVWCDVVWCGVVWYDSWNNIPS